MKAALQVLALSGGIGGAKLVAGLAKILPPDELIVIANTGDDFTHLGLHISPDIDTLLYTLAGVADPERGWGRAQETWSFLAAVEELGGETWFQLGDKDLAMHVHRTQGLLSGQTLSEVSKQLAGRLGVEIPVVPMSDDPVRTCLDTESGLLEFQDYFVRRRCEPMVSAIEFKGASTARISPRFENQLQRTDLAAILICPSNPYLSIDPILSVPGVLDLMAKNDAPVIAVSPFVHGDAVKGPTAKIMSELGLQVSAVTIAGHYGELIDGFVLDSSDASLVDAISKTGVELLVTDTLMQTMDDRITLAGKVLEFAREIYI